MDKKIIILSILSGFTALLLGFGCCFYDKPMVLTTTCHQAEMGEAYNPFKYVSFLFLASNSDLEIIGDIDTNKEGIYDLTLKIRSQEEPVRVTVKDTKAPEVQLKSLKADTVQELEPGDFVESEYDAQEISYTFTEETEGTINTIGKSKVSIEAEDSSGNRCRYETTLQRIEDVTAPVIKGLELEYNVIEGQELDISDITVKDDLDPRPELKIDTSEVNFNSLGIYEIKVTAKDATGNSNEAVRVVNVIENPEWSKDIVYLTFDDGPSENTKKILEILDNYDIKATFFVTGNNQNCNKYIKEAYDKGHTIGLHTYTHNYDTVYASEKAYFNDLQKISEMVKNLTGYESKIIRFPGGSSNTVSYNINVGIMSRLTEDVQKKGYQYFDWNVSSSDASGWNVSADTIYKSATKGGSGNLVVLMHDVQGKETTVEALPRIIEYYKKRGFEFRALALDSFPAQHGVNN